MRSISESGKRGLENKTAASPFSATGRSVARGVRRLVSGVLAFACASWVAQAAAQDTTFTLDRAQLSGAPDDGFMVYRPYMGEETRIYGSGALGWTLNPLRDSHFGSDVQIEGSAPVTSQFPVYLSAGAQIAGIVGINLHVPFTPLELTGPEPVEVGTVGITDRHAAMNDVRLDLRGKLFETNDRSTRLGAFGAFTVPTGSRRGFGGDGQATGLLGVNGEHDFGGFLISGHLATHFRPSFQLGTITADQGEPLHVGSELRYAVGAYLPMRDDRLRLGVEVWGSTGLGNVDGEPTFFRRRNTTFEWLAQGRFMLDKEKSTYLNAGAGTRLSDGYGSADIRVLVSLGHFWILKDKEPPAPPPKVQIVDRPDLHDKDSDGDGYPDDIDKCPDVKEDGKKPDKTDGCPAPKDNDKDGIIDVQDKCPNDPEDMDGIDDEDGCPETDADKDKVLDEVDKCPKEPGPPNADAEKNGCPTLTKVTAEGTVALLKPIEFDNGKARIKPVSFPILKEVATLLNARDNIALDIHGHTDSVGTHAANMQLSKDRAKSVVDYLVGQGIDRSRLTSDGFGPDQPVASNATAEGRARNRRVEFKIREVESGKGLDDDEAWE